jgi:trigger factor
MKVDVRDLEKSQKELSINVSKEHIDVAYEKGLKAIRKTAKIPGFRQGMAPDDLVKKYYHNKIMSEALEKVINDAITNAFKEQTINPLNMPLVKDVKYEEDNSISFKVQVDVYPQFEVANYKGFEFLEEVSDVSDSDVEEELKALQLRYATYNPKNENDVVATNDLVTIDIIEDIDGSIEESKDFAFVIDNNDFHKDFNESVKGMKKGESKEFVVEYPNEHSDKRFAGKKVKYKVFIKEVKERILPELNDDFAKQIGDTFENLNALKENVLERMKESTNIRSKNELFEKILKKIIDENPFDVPESMIVNQSQLMAKQLIDSYKQMYGEEVIKQFPMDKIVEDMKPRAEFQVKSALIINKIAEREQIIVADEEIEKKIRESAEKMKMEYEKLKDLWAKNKVIENIKDNLLIDKVYDFLVKENKIEQKSVQKEKGRDANKES